MNSDPTISHLLDELVSGQAGGEYLHENLDLILSWLANPDSELVARFRSEYVKRNITQDILRGYVFFILQQKLFSNSDLQPHQVLGLSAGATKDQVKLRYRKLMRVYHPDKAAGNIENFNSIAEKINLAYRQQGKQNKKPAHAKTYAPNAANTNFSSVNVSADNIEGQFVRKIRHTFGSVKQFQILFFGGAASFCLFVIVLLYLQSGDSAQLQPYSSRSNTGANNQVEIKHEADKTPVYEVPGLNETPIIETTVSENVEPLQKDEAGTKTDAEAKVESYSETQAQQASTNIIVNNDRYSLPALDKLLASEDPENQVRSSTPEYITDNKNVFLTDKISQARNDSAIMPEVIAPHENITEFFEKSLQEIMSEGVDNTPLTANPDLNDSITARGDNFGKDAAQSQASIDLTEPVAGAANSNQINTVVGSATSNISIDENSENAGEITGRLDVDKEVSDFAQASINHRSANQTDARHFIASVREIEVPTLKNHSVQRFPVANIIEKRFVRKFLIEYLESIENGNVTRINSYLSNNLVINGVPNNKEKYLKYTNNLIDQTSKRQYHVQFVGDVLRLDKGVFRITVTLNYTYVYKNNIVSKNTAQKRFVIKRYTNGSEILDISSA